MREVAIIGIGQTTVDEHWEISLRDLAAQAILSALQDAGRESVDGIFVGNMLSGLASGQENLGALIADWTGLKHTEAYKVESACGSGASALRVALMGVASGEMECAVAAGVEKMTETKGSETTAALATAADADYESAQGVSFVALNALVMQRYLFEYRWKHTDFAPFSINAHANAMHNPYARLHEKATEKDYYRARMIADPINLMDASPIGDGAAAVVIAPAEKLRGNGHLQIIIAGSASATDTLALHDRAELTWLAAAEKSAKKAYSIAGIGPADIDFFELHDAFSIMSALSLEAAGFAERGQGPRLALEGEILPGGRIPISTRGGLKARGHPVGATGVYQIVEAVQQLRGEAGDTQIDGARIGMTQNIGGSGATVITHILVGGDSG
jgi:acetyl-CoA C-acetyltransferase